MGPLIYEKGVKQVIMITAFVSSEKQHNNSEILHDCATSKMYNRLSLIYGVTINSLLGQTWICKLDNGEMASLLFTQELIFVSRKPALYYSG